MAIVVLLAVIYTMLLTPVNALLSVDKFNRGSLVYLILITGGLVSGVRSDNPNPPGFSAKFISVSHAESDIFAIFRRVDWNAGPKNAGPNPLCRWSWKYKKTFWTSSYYIIVSRYLLCQTLSTIRILYDYMDMNGYGSCYYGCPLR